MGDCGGLHSCSKFLSMQLFHELKQQFPTLPDHVVSQCIVQSNHDRETCARRLRARQNSRPPPGAFPPPAPQLDDQQREEETSTLSYLSEYPPLRLAMSEQQRPQQITATLSSQLRPLALLDIVDTRSAAVQTSSQESTPNDSLLSPPSYEPNATSSLFALSVNVNCSPHIVEAHDSRTTCEPTVYQPTLIPTDPSTRNVTSVSLTLRPPTSSESQQSQLPTSSSIDISSQGPSSLSYSTSSTDHRNSGSGYQSHLQISIARNKRPKKLFQPRRPSSLGAFTDHDASVQSSCRPPGLPVGSSIQEARPTSTMSAPTTPSSGAAESVCLPSNSLPTTPLSTEPSTSLGAIPRVPRQSSSRESSPGYPPEYQAILDGVPDELKSLVTEQLIGRDRLAAVVAAEKKKLEALEQDVDMLNQEISPEERQLHSEIYQLQLECDRLAEEVDRASGSRVPLGETSEEFYQNIYTGQQFVPATPNTLPPPLPSQPPAWEPQPSHNADNQDELEGPPWLCTECNFGNHPLMQKCEMCDTTRLVQPREGETQDIHIRVTHHHKFPPRRTLKNWAI